MTDRPVTAPSPNAPSPEAGRELDALVAEKVMGYPGAAIGGWRDPRELPDGRVLPGLTPPAYSTDIAAAWEVVEKIQQSGHLILSLNWSHDAGWWCDIVPASGPSIDTEYFATAPEAICRAALLSTETPA